MKEKKEELIENENDNNDEISKKKSQKKKGFTLIELLAVIVILGILMAVAIPAVTRYIDDSKKKTYISTVKSLVDTVRYGVTSGDNQYEVKVGKSRKYSFNQIQTEKGIITKSPYGNFDNTYSYVLVQRDNKGNYTYKVQVKDSDDYVIPLTNTNNLTTNSIKKVNELTEEEQLVSAEYPTYAVGDKITYKNSNWYVIKDSTSKEEYVTLMKESVLTNAELGPYAYNNYDIALFDKDESNSSDYTTSNLKSALEAYMTNKNMTSDLKFDENGYKIRLITDEELIKNLGWKSGKNTYAIAVGNTVPIWVYSGYGENQNKVWGYWAMKDQHSDNDTVLIVDSDGILLPGFGSFGVRPVINLLKSAISS